MSRKNAFSLEKSMRVVMRHNKRHEPHSPPVNVDDITITEPILKDCIIKVAHFVEHDDTYLPIFERLTNELEELRRKNKLKDYAHQIVRQNITL